MRLVCLMAVSENGAWRAGSSLCGPKEERRMQKGIVISEEIYYKMLESYDKAMKELEELRQQLDEMKQKNAPA